MQIETEQNGEIAPNQTYWFPATRVWKWNDGQNHNRFPDLCILNKNLIQNGLWYSLEDVYGVHKQNGILDTEQYKDWKSPIENFRYDLESLVMRGFMDSIVVGRGSGCSL